MLLDRLAKEFPRSPRSLPNEEENRGVNGDCQESTAPPQTTSEFQQVDFEGVDHSVTASLQNVPRPSYYDHLNNEVKGDECSGERNGPNSYVTTPLLGAHTEGTSSINTNARAGSVYSG